MPRFDWSDRMVQKLCRFVSAMWFDSNALEMTTAEHCTYLTKFMSCLYVSTCGTVLENVIIIKLRRLKSTRAGACIIQILQEVELEPAITQNQKDWESFKLNHKHNHSP